MLIDSESRKKAHPNGKTPSGPRAAVPPSSPKIPIPMPMRPADRGGVPPTVIIRASPDPDAPQSPDAPPATPPVDETKKLYPKGNTPPRAPSRPELAQRTSSIESAAQYFKDQEARAAAAAASMRVLDSPHARPELTKEATDPTPPVRMPSAHSVAREIRVWRDLAERDPLADFASEIDVDTSTPPPGPL